MLTFIKSSTTFRALLVLLTLAFLVPFVSLAQMPEGAGDTSLDSGDTVAYTSITNASLIGQDEDNLVVSFSIVNNGSRPQFDIRYGIELVRKEGAPGEETQVIVDSFVSQERVVVSAGETVTKVVGHPLAGIPPGTYEIWVIAQTSGGAMLGIAKAADYTVASADVVEIVAESCLLTVAGETGTTYDLYQGVDVATTEDIILSCLVKNHGAGSATVLPNFMTYERNVYGEQVTVSVPAQTPITLASGAEQRVSFTIPKATVPQAYDVVLSLVDETTRAVKSNNLIAHYVIQGASATILTVDFDKNAYRAGEQIGLKLNWTPAADTFEDSRAGSGTDIGTIQAVTRVVDGNGVVCSERVSTVLSEPAVVIRTQSMIDCVRPAASVQLVSADGTVLATREIAVEVEEDLAVGASSPSNKNSALMFVTIVAFALALLAVLVAMNRKKKINFVGASKVLFIFAIAAGGFFGAQVEKVEAVSWNHVYYNSSGYHNVLVSADPNKYSFSPGEAIIISSRIVSATCSNGRTPAHHLTAILGGQTATISYRTSNTSTYYSSGQLTAPSAPGVYTITMRMQVLSYVSTRTFQISVSLPPPPPPPPPAPTGNVIVSGCTIAVGASTCNSTIEWSTAFATSPNLRNVHATVGGSTQYNSGQPHGSGSFALRFGSNVVSVRNGTTNLHSQSRNVECAGGSGWNGSICAPATPPPPPTGTISVTDCQIPVGAGSCVGTVTWNINNPTSPNVHNSSNNTTPYVVASGVSQPITLTHGVNSVMARNNTNTLDTDVVNVACAAGSNWNGSVCDAVPPPPPEPSISLLLSRELIRSGETVNVTVDVEAEYTAQCTIYGVTGTPIVFTHNGTPADPISSDVYTSRPLSAAQVVTVTCVPTPANGAASNTATSRVDVVPVVQEI